MEKALLQSMLSSTKLRIRSYEELLVAVTETARDLYEESDKNDPSTLESFKALNKLRDLRRKIKADIAKQAKISKYLKDVLRGKTHVAFLGKLADVDVMIFPK